VFPNKQKEKFERYYEGKLIDTDTYIGGTVECLQQGVFRSDIPVKFKLQKEGFDKLISQTDDIMKFAVEIEANSKVEDVANYEEVKADIINKLENLKSGCPFIDSEPLIYHVDVAAMYPNIILTNRLQPTAVVNE
jgi:DNA polymerase epsilon subunit 1